MPHLDVPCFVKAHGSPVLSEWSEEVNDEKGRREGKEEKRCVWMKKMLFKRNKILKNN